MQFLTKVLALTRLLLLKRQWRVVQPRLVNLPPKTQNLLAAFVHGEALRAGKHPVPQFYASSAQELYRPWGDAAETAMQRIEASSESDQMRGLATWLAVVFHETQRASHPGLKALHAQVAERFQYFRSLHERLAAIRQAA